MAVTNFTINTFLGNSKPDIENHLISQFKSGNEFAFELIFHQTKGKLKGFLKKVLPVTEDVESILQEIYLKLWLNRNSIDTKKNIEAFLFTIAKNRVIDVMRKRLIRQKYLENLWHQLREGQSNSLDTLEKVEYSELEKMIFELVEKLPPRRQLIFKLNRINGLSYSDISKRLNISENTVDSQMRKALDFLRVEIKHYLTILISIYFIY